LTRNSKRTQLTILNPPYPGGKQPGSSQKKSAGYGTLSNELLYIYNRKERTMGEQRNLTEENVDELKTHLERMQKDNADLNWEFFQQEGIEKEEQPSRRELLNAIEELDRKIDRVFGEHVLVDKKWVFLNIMKGENDDRTKNGNNSCIL